MIKRIPADEVPEQLAASPAGTVTAAGVGVGNTDNGGGHHEVDEYDQLLAVLGRTEEEDERIAVHEAGHAVVRACSDIRWAARRWTRDPDTRAGIWGERYVEAFSKGRGDASNVRGALAPMMPKAGEDRSSVSDIFGKYMLIASN